RMPAAGGVLYLGPPEELLPPIGDLHGHFTTAAQVVRPVDNAIPTRSYLVDQPVPANHHLTRLRLAVVVAGYRRGAGIGRRTSHEAAAGRRRRFTGRCCPGRRCPRRGPCSGGSSPP